MQISATNNQKKKLYRMRTECNRATIVLQIKHNYLQGGPKTDTQFYFGDNFGNSAPIQHPVV